MKFYKASIGLCLVASIYSCKGDKKQMDDLVADLAQYECRAENLREVRYKIADEIRFTQDSIMRTSGDTMVYHQKLESLGTQKHRILTQSLALADTIEQKLDFIREKYLTDKQKEAAFNQLLLQDLQQCKK